MNPTLIPSRLVRTTRRFVLTAMTATLALMLTVSASALAGATTPDLGTAGSFGVLAGSAVTNTGPTTVNGDVGVSPGTAMTGFPPGITNGAKHTADALALQAQQDATIAYNVASKLACNFDLTGQDLGGMTLIPGVYCFNSSAQLTGQLTLDGQGNPNSVFIFKIGSTLTTASNARVAVTNGAQPCNTFWRVGSSATLGTGTEFAGNILALTSITLNTGASTSAGLYARNGAITLDSNDVESCGETQGATSTPTEVSTNTAVATSTSTSTATTVPATSTATRTLTTIPTSTPASTMIPATSTSIPTATSTQTPAATSTATAIINATALPSTATNVPTPAATNPPASTPTNVPLNTPEPGPTGMPTQTQTPVILNTPARTAVATLTPANTAITNDTPVPSNTSTAVAMATDITMPSVTATATLAINTPEGTPTSTVTGTAVETTLAIASATSVATMTPAATSTVTATPSVGVPEEIFTQSQTGVPPVPEPFLPPTGGANADPWIDPFAYVLATLLMVIGYTFRKKLRNVAVIARGSRKT